MSKSIIKPVIFFLSLFPLVLLVFRYYTNMLGANPVESITHQTGDWTLRFLLLTLTATPLRRFTSWSWPIRVRRMLGLFAFFYALLHLMTYFWLDQFFDWPEIWLDILDRPFVTIGMLGFLLLIPLAITSTNAMMKRLGKTWKKLHRLAYLIPVLGVIHFWWLVKADIQEPLVYALLLGLLFAGRFRKTATTKSRSKVLMAEIE